MLTALEKKNEFAEILLKRGSNPNIRDEKSGRTALFHAVENDCDFIIKLLLKYKADPKLNNYLGVCPIDAAKDLNINSKYTFNVENTLNTTTNLAPNVRNSSVHRKRHRKPKETDAKKPKITFISSLQKLDSQTDIDIVI